jgi:carboxylesterase
MIPWNTSNLKSHPHPARSYGEAIHRIDSLTRREEAGLNPVCQLELMTHGTKTERAIILVHGYTKCPAQFSELGNRFYKLGYNVIIAPLPHHGLANRMTEDHAKLSAEEMAGYADETVDIARGLGNKVIMAGLSCGGVIAAWAAQERRDLYMAEVISPAFGFKIVPTPLTIFVMNLYSVLPNKFEWWDNNLKTNIKPDYCYPIYSKRALTQMMRLGVAVRKDSRHFAPNVNRLVVVTNSNDNKVNNELTMKFVNIWRSHKVNVITYTFDSKLGLDHDIIDHDEPHQNIELVYPKLIELLK